MNTKLIIIILACLLAFISLAVIIKAPSDNKVIGSTVMSTEDYFNNCSNNASFVKCDWNNSIANCSADGKPIQITGWVNIK